MELRIQVVSILVSAVLLVGILELVRRRRLLERYAILWLLSAALLLILLVLVRRRRLLERYAILWLLSASILFALSVWKGLLEDLAHAIGIFSPPNALFVIAFGFVLVLLLHFSLAVSRLSDQSKVLAQRLALLEKRVGDVEQNEAEPEPELERAQHR